MGFANKVPSILKIWKDQHLPTLTIRPQFAPNYQVRCSGFIFYNYKGFQCLSRACKEAWSTHVEEVTTKNGRNRKLSLSKSVECVETLRVKDLEEYPGSSLVRLTKQRCFVSSSDSIFFFRKTNLLSVFTSTYHKNNMKLKLNSYPYQTKAGQTKTLPAFPWAYERTDLSR